MSRASDHNLIMYSLPFHNTFVSSLENFLDMDCLWSLIEDVLELAIKDYLLPSGQYFIQQSVIISPEDGHAGAVDHLLDGFRVIMLYLTEGRWDRSISWLFSMYVARKLSCIYSLVLVMVTITDDVEDIVINV